MRDIWYTDKRDLVKWAVLFQLAHMFKMDRILQIAYYNNDTFEKVTIPAIGILIDKSEAERTEMKRYKIFVSGAQKELKE